MSELFCLLSADELDLSVDGRFKSLATSVKSFVILFFPELSGNPRLGSMICSSCLPFNSGYVIINHRIISVGHKGSTTKLQVNQESGHEKSHLQYDSLLVCLSDLPIALQFVVLQPNSDPGRLNVEVSRSHTHTHTHTVALLWTSDQSLAEAATYTTHSQTQTLNSHVLSGIRTRYLGNGAAASPPTPHAHTSIYLFICF